MGVIKSQSIKSLIYTYLGVGVGFFNAVVLLPNLIDPAQIGLLGLVDSVTKIISLVFTLGIPAIVLRLFPYYREDSGKHNGFFSFVLYSSVISIVVAALFYYLTSDLFIPHKLEVISASVVSLGIIILTSFRILFRNFDIYISMLYNTVMGSITENFILKVAFFLALLAFWLLKGYSFILLFLIYIFALSLPGIISIIYLWRNKIFSFDIKSFISSAKVPKKEIASVGFFGLLGSVGGIIILEIDRVMISNMSTLEDTGIYATAFFFGIFVGIPSRGIKKISSVVVADAWQRNDISNIKDIYSKSCLNQFILGAFLFLGIWLNIDYIFNIIPEIYRQGKWVILWIGIGQLIDMITGVNAEIIVTSKYYKVNNYFMIILIFLVIMLNWLLIPLYGISGAAFASAAALLVNNILRFAFLYYKFGFQPLNINIIKVMLIGIICFFAGTYAIVEMDNFYIGILLEGAVLTVLFWSLIYFAKASEDVNKYIKELLEKFKLN